MDENIRNALGDEVLAEILKLDELEVGSEEKVRAIDGVCKLYKLGLEESKQDNEIEAQFAKLNNEAIEQRSSKIWNGVKYGLEAAAIVIPAAVSLIFMKKGFKFEETGSYTSTTFRNMFSNFKPKK